jgi:hypothetical protein
MFLFSNLNERFVADIDFCKFVFLPDGLAVLASHQIFILKKF